MRRILKKILSIPIKEWFYILLIFIGIAMVFAPVIKNFSLDNKEKAVSWLTVLGELGVGVFPTGVISLILERMQIREKSEEIRRIRTAILRNIDISIHSYFNTVCNSAIAENSSLKDKKIFDIFNAIKDEAIVITTDESSALKQLLMRMKDSFESPNPVYLAIDIFKENEERHFRLLIEKGEKLLELIENDNCMSMDRHNFLSYLETACKEITECNKYLNMSSDGNNIFIPVTTD
jgi:hypothetical protein